VEEEKKKDGGLERWATAIYNSMVEGVLTIDKEGIINVFNPAAERITGYSRKEVIGKRCFDIFRNGFCETDKCLLNKAVYKCKTVVNKETQITTQDNRLVPVLIHASPLIDDKGNLIGIVETFQDISRLKKLEQERADFISMLAHDLKTPAITIGGLSSRLLRERAGTLTSKQREYLKVIYEDAKRLESLTSEFLELSRMESGNYPLHLGIADLNKIIESLVKSFQPKLEEKGLRLEINIRKPLPSLKADFKLIERVFSNLLDNAYKFIDKNGVISFSVEEGEKGVVIRVADNGWGIDSDDLKHIFNKFFRTRRENLSYKTKGTGLGLAIVKNIIEAHGGSIKVASEVGNGTTFTIMLPYDPEEEKVKGDRGKKMEGKRSRM